jgi:hypothetical protein
MSLDKDEFFRFPLLGLELRCQGLKSVCVILQEVLIQHVHLVFCDDLEVPDATKLFYTLEGSIED